MAISVIFPTPSKFSSTKATKCVVQSDLCLKTKCMTGVFISWKFPYKDEIWCIPLINLSIFSPQGGVYRHIFTLIVKRSKSVFITFVQRNSHRDTMATSFSLFSCHILTKKKKQKLYRSTTKISLCLTSIQWFTIADDLIMTLQ